MIIAEHIKTLTILTRIIDSADVCRRHHSYKVEKHAILICRKLKLMAKEIKTIKIASIFHDIGKVGIDLRILKKPGKLTPEEWDQVRLHPDIGANMVGQLSFLEGAAHIIRYHHSRFSGGGYPNPSLSGESIAIGSRIIAVTDAFDAMINNRPYRKAMLREDAFSELKRCAGGQFDPRIVDAFCSVVAH